MKNKIFILVFAFFFTHTYSQNEINRVIYKIGLIEAQSQKSLNQTEQRKQYVSDVKDNLTKLECELIFNNNCSIFKVIEKLSTNEDSFAYRNAKRFVDGLYYKNIQDSLKITQIELDGKKLNIKKNINEYIWEISDETKEINGYTCYKATCVYEEFDNLRDKQLTFTPEVWFTPAIPSSFGPKGLDGLPGLVLQGRFNDRIYFYATKIEFDIDLKNKSLNLEIKSPLITEKEYHNMLLNIYEKLKKE